MWRRGPKCLLRERIWEISLFSAAIGRMLRCAEATPTSMESPPSPFAGESPLVVDDIRSANVEVLLLFSPAQMRCRLVGLMV